MARKKSKESAQVKNRKREIVGILTVFLSIIILIALVTHHPGDWPGSSRKFDEPAQNWIGRYGAYISHVIFESIGYSGYFLMFFSLIFGGVVFFHKSYKYLIKPSILLFLNGVFLPLIASLTADIGSDTTIPSSSPGGTAGTLLAHLMVAYLGRTGSYLVSLAAVMISIVLTTSLKPSTIIEWLIKSLRTLGNAVTWIFLGIVKLTRKPARKPLIVSGEKPEENEPIEAESPFLTPVEEEVAPEPAIPGSEPTIVDYGSSITAPQEETGDEEVSEGVETVDESEEYEEEEEYILDQESTGYLETYELPGLDLLGEPVNNVPSETREEMLEKAQRVMESLGHFNIEAEVRQITPGPIVTRYELTLAPGVKIGRVVGLHDDLAMTLRAKGGIRILAPIPGKAAIGIEVPNKTRSLVYFSEIAESEAFIEAEGPLTFAIGKTTSGDPVVADLGKMPHLLIAGSTGSGKSVCINALIASILMKATPDRVRLIMVDPKVVELSIYNTIPHLLTPVITDPKRAADSLKWAVREMESRYRQLASMGVRDLTQYNARVADLAEKAVEDGETEIPEPLPLIVIIIDEYADLMVVASNDIEESIARLAQMARAVGMHLVIATQRPSADVITGLIKANFPSRIAFKVMQASNSRIILDQGGADKLLGLGDMLFLQVGKPEPIRLHGAYITNDESERLVDFVASQSKDGPVEVNEEMFRRDEEEVDNILGLRDPNERDSLFFEAARLVVRHQQGSVSLLQRRLKVGYARAARLIDQLELAGIVSPYDGSKAREVLVDGNYIDELETGNI